MKMKLRLILFLLSFMLSFFLKAQSGPGGVGTNDGSSSLVLWLDANKEVYVDTLQISPSTDGNKVMLWKDLSGSNNHVSAKSDSSSPTLGTSLATFNNQNALRFYRSGTKNRRTFLASKSFAKTNDITIYCIFYALSKAAGNDVTPYTAKTYDPNMWYYGEGLVDAGVAGFVNDVSLSFCDTSLAAGAGDVTDSTDYCVKLPASVNQVYMANLQKEAWSGKLRISHNLSTESVFKAGNQPINSSTNYFIGSNSNVTAKDTPPFFDGYISTVLVYNKILNRAEKTILENSLSAKYNFALKSNDLYTFDNWTAGNYDYEVVGIGKATDGSSQLTAKGQGIVEISESNEFEKGDFIFIGHNGKTLSSVVDDLPEGVQFRADRRWIFSQTGNTKQMNIILDPKDVPLFGNTDVVLLIDTDNDGLFNDEKIGEGMIPVTSITGHGRFLFSGVNFKNGNQFTFGKFKAACQKDCDSFFTPNGDGNIDVYYIADSGKTSIYDRAGRLIKAISTPAYWDGTDEKGELSVPGIYFLISNDEVQKTVTLIR